MKAAIVVILARAIERIMRHTEGTVGPFLLMISGIGGVLLWPPPALIETYATISWMTTLYGVEGPAARALMGTICLNVWLFSTRESMRKAAQITSLVVILALIVNFAVARQGLMCFLWLGASLYGVIDVLRGELRRIEEGKARIIANRLDGEDHAT